MSCRARDLYTLFQSRLMHMKSVKAFTAKRRYQRRMDIYNSVLIFRKHITGNYRQKSSKCHNVNALTLQIIANRLVENDIVSAAFLFGYYLCADTGFLCSFKRIGIGIVGHYTDYFSAFYYSAFLSIDQCL